MSYLLHSRFGGFLLRAGCRRQLALAFGLTAQSTGSNCVSRSRWYLLSFLEGFDASLENDFGGVKVSVLCVAASHTGKETLSFPVVGRLVLADSAGATAVRRIDCDQLAAVGGQLVESGRL